MKIKQLCLLTEKGWERPDQSTIEIMQWALDEMLENEKWPRVKFVERLVQTKTPDGTNVYMFVISAGPDGSSPLQPRANTQIVEGCNNG